MPIRPAEKPAGRKEEPASCSEASAPRNTEAVPRSSADTLSRSTNEASVSSRTIGTSISVPLVPEVEPHTAAEVNETRVFTAPVPGSLSGLNAATVTADQVSSSVPSQPLATNSSRSPALVPVTFPASSTEAGPASVTDPLDVTLNAGSGARVATTSEGPGKLTPTASKVWAGTPELAVLDSCMPAGITSGSAGRVVVRMTPTWPVAASPGTGT